MKNSSFKRSFTRMRGIQYLTISKTSFKQRLLKWFDKHGRKNLPWQRDKTPYRVLVSEIMLQQTQVNTVIPYFQRFIQAFPTIADLANASEDEVMRLWAGLGYYSRARNLHQAAQVVMQNFGGMIPNEFDALLKLPGIGHTTASAILSLAFNQPATILDGNVKRVLTRIHGITTSIDNESILQLLWQLAIFYTPKRKRSADYTQAIMDMGATLCVRKNPQCCNCPFKKCCVAYANKLVNEIPRKKTKKQLPTRLTTFVIFKYKNSVLLQKRPSRGIWGGLWSMLELTGETNVKALARYCLDEFNIKPNHYHKLQTLKHSFTHFHLTIYPVVIEINTRARKSLAACKQIWYNLNKDISIGLPKPVQVLINTLRRGQYDHTTHSLHQTE